MAYRFDGRTCTENERRQATRREVSMEKMVLSTIASNVLQKEESINVGDCVEVGSDSELGTSHCDDHDDDGACECVVLTFLDYFWQHNIRSNMFLHICSR